MRKAIRKNIREHVKALYDGRCGYCGEKPSKLCIDHIVPVQYPHLLNGLDVNDVSNLMPACFSCNNYKLTRLLEEFRNDLQCQVDRARQYSINFKLAERYGQIIVKETPIKFYFEKYLEPKESK